MRCFCSSGLLLDRILLLQFFPSFVVVVVHSLSHVQLCSPMDCSTQGFSVLPYLPELAQTQMHWVGDASQPSHPLSSHFPTSPNLSSIRVFSSELTLHIRWSKFWSFSFSISLSNEYSGLISFRMDWLDLLAVQGTLKSLLQLYGLKAINSLTLSFLHSPSLISIHDHRKNHSLD